jgi:hypothetical protein
MRNAMKSSYTFHRIAFSFCCWLTVQLGTVSAQGEVRKYKANLADRDAKRVCVLLVCDTDADEKIGPSVRIDLQNMRTALKDAFKGREHLLKLDELSGPKATPDEIRMYYRALITNEGDSVAFYYSGHGAVIDGEHLLTMKQGSLKRKDLQEMLRSKPHQFILILTDCCSSHVVTQKSEENRLMETTRSPINAKTVNSLFLKHKGIVDISAANHAKTAANPNGQFAYCDNEVGGHFTYCFVSLLHEPSQSVPGAFPVIGGAAAAVNWGDFYTRLAVTTSHYRFGGLNARFNMRAVEAAKRGEGQNPTVHVIE